MPITQLDAITFVNQNMNVVASTQNDYRNSIESQKYAAVVASLKANSEIEELNELKDDQQVGSEREHQKEKSEEESGEKAKEIEIKQALNKRDKREDKEEFDTPYRILDIKV